VAVQDTFIIAAARLGALRDARKLRPWLYAVARSQCRRAPHPVRPGPAAAPAPEQDAALPEQDATLPEQDDPSSQTDAAPPDSDAAPLDADAAPLDADAAPSDVAAGAPEADPAAGIGADPELRGLASRALSGLHPSEREVIELNLGHYLAGSDLAAVLGVSRSQAHALVGRVRGRLERSLGVPLAARADRQACPALDTLLADGGERLTRLTTLARKRIGRHVAQCETCARNRRAELDDVVRSVLERPAAPPSALREEVLRLCAEQTTGTIEDDAYREWVTQRAGQFGPAGFPRPVKQPRRVFVVTGAAAAAGILIVAASTGIVTVLTLGGSHVPRSVDTARTQSATTSAGATGNVVATRSATVTRGPAAPGSAPASFLLGPHGPSASVLSPSASATPSASRASATPSPAGSTGSHSPSPSASPTPTPTPPLPPASPGGQWPPPSSPSATGMP
jgi:DNA-directed RNA polymerase specialized sigma24 family protein